MRSVFILIYFKVRIKNEYNNNNTSLELTHLYSDTLVKYNFYSFFFFNRGREAHEGKSTWGSLGTIWPHYLNG